MGWQPISEEEMWVKINAGWARMSPRLQRLWEVIRIEPEKWSQHPYGDAGGGFWAVALIGRTVVWYNDIEDGFNRSHFSHYGIIDEYWCNQDELEMTVQYVLNSIETGEDQGPYLGPPQAVRF